MKKLNLILTISLFLFNSCWGEDISDEYLRETPVESGKTASVNLFLTIELVESKDKDIPNAGRFGDNTDTYDDNRGIIKVVY